MKKSIIAAGAASIALAAMPIVGVFADTSTVTDKFSVTLSTTCSLSEQSATPYATAQAHVTTGPTFTTDTYSLTMTAGKVAEVGTSTLHIVCNDTSNGYEVTGTFDDLKIAPSSTGNDMIPYSSTAVIDGTSGWNAILSGSPLTSGATGNVYDQKSTTKNAADTTAAITYKVGSSTVNTPSTYTGNASYILTWGS